MNNKIAKGVGTVFGCLVAIMCIIAAIVMYLAVAAIGWIAVCGIVKLITLCFGWTFSWYIATGVWLILVLLNAISSYK